MANVYTVTVCVRVKADNAQDAKDKVTEDLEELRSAVTLIQADFFSHADMPCPKCPADLPEDQARADHCWSAHGIVVNVAP